MTNVLQGDDDDDDKLADVMASTVRELLTSFGYNDLQNATTYLGLNRNRNFWHDAWVVLALQLYQERGFETNRIQESSVADLVNGLQERYGSDNNNKGLVWHWTLKQKPKSDNVLYCGDNALWYLIQRRQPQSRDFDKDNFSTPFWEFVRELQANDVDGLVSVGNVYPQVRLHPNTELAALLVF